MRKHVQHLFIDALENSLSPEQQVYFSQHLKECPDCTREFASLQAVYQQTANPRRQEPDASFWNDYWLKLHRRLLETGQLKKQSRWELRLPVETWLKIGLAAAAVIVFIVGLYTGKLSFRLRDITPEPVNQLATIQQSAQSYLERSKLLVLGFANLVTDRDPYVPNFAQQKVMSRQLLAESAELRTELSPSEQKRLLNLIDDLEVVLLQIANLDSTYDTNMIEMIQQGLERKSLLLKLSVTRVES